MKQTDETIQSDATSSPDSELVVTLPSAGTYLIEILVLWKSGATPDFKYQLNYSGTVTDMMFQTLFRAPVTPPFSNSGTPPGRPSWFNEASLGVDEGIGSAAGTYSGGLRFRGVLEVSSGGDLEVSWAQNTSDASDTTVVAGSYIYYDLMSDLPGIVIVKPADESRSSDTVLTVDDDLQFPTEASKQYVCEMLNFKECASITPQFKQQIKMHSVNQAVAALIAVRASGDNAFPGDTVGRMRGTFREASWVADTIDNENIGDTAHRNLLTWAMIMDTSDDTWEYLWAQRVSNANATIMKKNSYIWYQEITPTP